MVYTGLGNKDQTFRWLNRAYDLRADHRLWLALPIFDPFRSDPRFAGLLKKIGLE